MRCGPGWDYYCTQQLVRGTQVEVYRHEPDGWLAIRPPGGSFSWLPARQVERAADRRVGKVLIDGAVAWVGSDVGSVTQHKWQVRLERNEQVEILGERSLSVGPGFATETYYQIAPPAGEFRWIHAEQATAPGAVAHRSAARTIQLTDYTSPGPLSPEDVRHSATGRASPAETRETPQTLSSEQLQQLQQRVDQLKIDLSLLVSQQIAKWDLQSLRRSVQQMDESARGTALSQQVRLLGYRIEEFERLQQQHERMTDPGSVDTEQERIQRHGVSPAPQTDSQVERTSWQEEIAETLETTAAVGTGIDRLAAEMAQDKPQFDAEGWLMPVHSTRRVAPPFALLDQNGRVVCYVQPSPGLNLRRYTKQQVGLHGEQRRMLDLNASLLTVTRVTRLSE